MERTATALPDPAGLSNAELIEIERDELAYTTSAAYRVWWRAIIAEVGRRALVDRHPAEGAR